MQDIIQKNKQETSNTVKKEEKEEKKEKEATAKNLPRE